MTSMNRRNFVATLGIAGTALLAGCNGSEQPAQTDDQAADETPEEASTLDRVFSPTWPSSASPRSSTSTRTA